MKNKDIGCKSCEHFVMPKDKWWGCCANKIIPACFISDNKLIYFGEGDECYTYKYKEV